MSDEHPDPGDGQDATTWLPRPLPPDAKLGPVVEPDVHDLMADDLGPGKAAEPDAAQTAQSAVPAGPVPSDLRVPAEEELLRALSGARRRGEKPERDWRVVVIATVLTLFTIFAPVQIITGGGVLLLVVFVVGGAFVVIGCPTLIRSLSTTGTMRLGPFASVAAGVIIMIVCAAMMVAGADDAISSTEEGATSQAFAADSGWHVGQ